MTVCKRSLWTAGKEQQLRRLWLDSSISTAQIGAILGFDKNTIDGKAHRMRLPQRLSQMTDSKQRNLSLPAEERIRITSRPLRKIRPQPPTHKLVLPLEMETRAPKFGRFIPPEKCRWPIGDPRDRDFRFCNKAQIPGKVYCKEHDEQAHVRPIK